MIIFISYLEEPNIGYSKTIYFASNLILYLLKWPLKQYFISLGPVSEVG